MKKFSLVFVIMLILLLALGTNLMAQTSTPPASGDGSEGSPYQIATLNNLYWISEHRVEWSKYFEQTANIDASTTSGWNGGAGFIPIGSETHKFTGSYDGQNHTIDELTINFSVLDFIGLFGYTDGATIQNLGVSNVNITGKSYTGGLVGYNASSTVSNSYSTGSVTAGNCVGGLVGYNASSSSVINSYSTGSVTGNSSVGGLVGESIFSSSVSNSYSTGSVTGSGKDVGGLVGYSASSTVSNSYSTGSVSGADNVGGLVGYNPSSTVTNSFWDTETSGQTSSAGGIGKTTDDMKTQSTFTDAGWDFTTMWAMDGATNSGYAFLRTAPKITTQAVTDITSTTATGNGNITDPGNPNPTQHGVCWSTSENPTTADNKTEQGAVSSAGAFTSNITGLNPETLYYVRAYATNTAGTSYGEQLSFTTLLTLAPTIQDSSVTFSNVQEARMDIGWTNGDGSNRAVFMLQGSSGTASPSDSASYTENSIFMSGDQIGSSGWYCVYNGTDSSVTVTGLSSYTEYRVMVCGYNGSAGLELYNTNTATNNPNNQTSVMTPPGNALNFDGSDDYVDCGNDASMQITGSITIEAWIKVDSWVSMGSVVGKIVHKGDKEGYILRLHESLQGIFDFSLGQNWSSWDRAVSTTAMSLGTWYHIAGTYDGNTIKVYINGVESGSQSYSAGIVDSETSLQIGANSRSNYFDGIIDEVRIWNIARDSTQIQATMYNMLIGNETGLVACYRFDEGTPGGDNTGVTTLPDLTSNGNDGILNNFALSGSTSNWVSSGAMDNEAPAAPGGLYAIALNDRVELHWSANSESDFSYYKIYRNTSSDTSSAYSIGISNPDTGFTDTNVDNDTLYYYRVTAVDSTGNESYFSVSDAAVPTLRSGNALDLDGDGDYIGISNLSATIADSNAFTLSGWVYPRNSSPSSPDLDHFFGFRNNSNADLYILQASATEVDARFRNSSGTNFDIMGSGLTVNEWQHFALTYDGDSLRLYRNGLKIGSTQASGTISSTTETFRIGLGSNNSLNYYLDGRVDEVRLWSIARDSADIFADMNRPLRGDEEGLVALWHMDEPTGTGTAYDATPNANDGTLQDNADFVSSGALLMGPPTVPADLYAIALDGQVELNWNADSEYDFSYYTIYRNTSNDTLSADSIGISTPDAGFTDTNVENDTLYYYWVTAVDSTGYESSFSVGDAAVPTEARGNTLDLDGYGDYVNCGDIDEIDGINKLTIEAKVLWRTLDYLSTIIAKRESHYDKIQFGLGESSNTDDIMIQIGNSGVLGYGYTSGDIISTGVWYHLAMVFDGTQASNADRLKLYVNGVERGLTFSGTIPATTDYPNTAPVTIGNESTRLSVTNVDGMIDEVRIWSIARNSADIVADMNSPLRGDEEGLIALWHMDEPTGTGTAYDAAPNANDGTLQHDADFIYSIAPIVAGIPDISFPEDSLYTLDLDDYVTDANDDLSDLSWTVSSAGSGKCLSLKKKGNISSYLFLVPESKETFKGGFLKSNEQAKVNKPGRFGRIAQDDMEMRLSGEPTSSDKQERISNNLLFVPAKNETGRFSKSAKFTKGIKEDMEMKVSVKQTNVDSILITIDDITHVATFTATLNYNVSDVPFVFTATDPSGASDPDTMTVTVISLNDAPVFISALPDTSFDEDTVLKVPLSFWFEYVEDVDDSVETLVWSIEGNDNVFTEISSDTVIFSSLSDWYGIDTLTVIVSDLGELSDTTTLAVTVNAVNDAPLPFGLISPAADETIDSLIISFVWHESIDPDPEDVVSYAFRLFGPGVDTTITELPDTSLIFDGSNIFQYDTVYSWYVEATDDVEITTSEETFQFRTPVLVGVDIFSQIPEVFSLSQNFPNPFNPITKIGYGLPEDSRVDIVIYNLLGQEVRKLVSEYQMAGYRFSIWDGRDDNGSLVSTGVYIYVMTANEFHDVKKMVILK